VHLVATGYCVLRSWEVVALLHDRDNNFFKLSLDIIKRVLEVDFLAINLEGERNEVVLEGSIRVIFSLQDLRGLGV
jgi:hypothetical protein